MQTLALGPEGTYLCCYTCGGVAAIDVDGWGDPLPDAEWPDLECPLTPGCPGRLVPEVLN